MKTTFIINDLIRKHHKLSESNEKAVKQFKKVWNNLYPQMKIIKTGKIIRVDPSSNREVEFEAEIETKL